MYLVSLQDAAALAAGISLVSFLQVGDCTKVSTPAGHYFSTCIATTSEHQDSAQHAVQGHSE